LAFCLIYRPWFPSFSFCGYYTITAKPIPPGRVGKYYPRLETVPLEHQKDDGSWDTSVDGEAQAVGAAYTTSVAVPVLGRQRHVLPTY